MRGLVFGDLHIGQGAGIGRAPGERVAEQAKACELVLLEARERDVDFVLFAGDAWERRSPSPDEILALERVLLKHLEKGGARIIAIPGNHDVSNTDAGTALDVLAEAGLLELYRRPELVPVSRKGLTVWVCCLPWAPVHRLVAADAGGDRDSINVLAARHLETAARGLRAMVPAGGRSILLSHFSVTTASTDTGADVSVFREPVLRIDELEACGFDAIALGHIHRRQDLGRSSFYVGSLVPLNFGETGDHGCYTLEIDDAGVRAYPLTLESRRFVTLDVTLPAHADDAVDAVESYLAGAIDGLEGVEPRPFVKWRYHCNEDAARAIDNMAIKRELEERCAHRAWVVPVVERVQHVKHELAEDGSDGETLEAYLRAAEVERDLARLLDAAGPYLQGEA